MANERAPGWVVPMMRMGYSARGLTYVLIGILAVVAAWTGGEAEGTKGALSELRQQPLGLVALWIVALGLGCYAIWRVICAWMNLEYHDTDAKGLIARAGQTVTGVIHLGLTVTAVRIALGGSGGGGGVPTTLLSRILEFPWGAMVVMSVGLIVVGAGIYYAHKGISEKYKRQMRATATSERLDPLLKSGLVAHGIVIAMIGGFLFFAGQNADAGQAGGLAKAFDTVRAQPFGRILLGVLGLGMLSFALYCFVEAIYRVVPRASGRDVTTLADRVKTRAERTARRAASDIG